MAFNFGGGGGGFNDYLDWIEEQQFKFEDLEGRELEQAETFSDLRRGELLDRSGFAGLINVGESVRRSDVTVAAQVAGLATDDPARIAYEDALAAEREGQIKQTRVVSGEQFRAEDAFAALQDRLENIDTEGFLSGKERKKLGAIRSDFEEFSKEFDFFEGDELLTDIEDILEENRKRRERERRRVIPDPLLSEGGAEGTASPTPGETEGTPF